MAEQKVTIKDVAREAGVSISTVSRYLNENFSSMSQNTKDRIQQVIQKLNYHPNKLAQGLKGQSRTIAIIVVNMSYPFCVSIIRAISEVLDASGYSLLVAESKGEDEKELTLLRSLVAQGVDAIILQTNGHNNDSLEELAKKMPILLVDRQFSFAGAYNVVTDNEAASAELTADLFREGYEEVLFISEPLEGLSTRIGRYEGYLSACASFQKRPWVCWVQRDDWSGIHTAVEEVAARVEKAAADRQRPFAVYTSNGLLMLEFYPLLSTLPFAVPEEMGLATFDEPSWVKITQPTITCVRQPTQEIGQLAAETVLARLRNAITPDLQQSTVRVIPSQIVPAAATQRRSRNP